MKTLRHDSIKEGLEQFGRVYLCGDLKFSNGVKHIQTDSYEIGISYYREYSADKPHRHDYNFEYNYVLEGEVKVLLIDKGEELHFKKGDLFVIEPNEPYIGKCLPETKVLFSKVPGGNDKVVLTATKDVLAWSTSWETIYIREGDLKNDICQPQISSGS